MVGEGVRWNCCELSVCRVSHSVSLQHTHIFVLVIARLHTQNLALGDDKYQQGLVRTYLIFIERVFNESEQKT